MESLPEAVLIKILASIPAVDLVLACRLVCCQWKNLVDGAALWILKCQQEGLTGAESQEDAENWQNFYFLSKKRKNLIKNPCGEEDLQHWGEVDNGGDGWKIEELPGDFGKEFPSEEVHKYFVTSYEWCRKAQVIDLRAEGYWEELMDTTQPKVVVKDWYAGRSDAGCLYELSVKLLSENEDVLAEYKSETIDIPQDNDANWTEVSYSCWAQHMTPTCMNREYFQAERSRRVLEKEKALSCVLWSHDPVIEQRDYTGRPPYIKLGNLLSHHCRCKMEMSKWERFNGL
ncbi:F-box only protein 2 [Grus japonensis]|uniref:F-box only protein 2 n=1 Tax=Grus japonensis TaxID=30415 RepID=A0ABC9XP19_GRUJA